MPLLEVGTKAPDFTLNDQNEEQVSLADFAGKWVILYFYPRAMTPGCTTQACDLTSAESQLTALNAVPLGVSPDKPQSLKKFEDREKLNFTLISDLDHTVAEAYGAWQEKSMYGKKYMGMARMTYVIDPTGKIAHVMPKVKAKTHLQDVVKVLKNMQE